MTENSNILDEAESLEELMNPENRNLDRTWMSGFDSYVATDSQYEGHDFDA